MIIHYKNVMIIHYKNVMITSFLTSTYERKEEIDNKVIYPGNKAASNRPNAESS